MYRALTNVNTEEFGQIKEGETLTDDEWYELPLREGMYFKKCEDEEVYNPLILADEIIEEDLKIEEFKDNENGES